MHSYDNHTNIPWNITQYNVPKLHFDQKDIVKQRMYSTQKKGVKVNDFYVTRRGFYMDYDLKQAKGVPSSGILFLTQSFISIKIHGITEKLFSKEIN